MRIPRKLTIDGWMWAVRIKRGLVDEKGEKVNGYCDFEGLESGAGIGPAHTIWIERDQSPEAQWHTFIHEVLHVILPGEVLGPIIHDENLIQVLEGPFSRFLETNGPVIFAPEKVRKPRKKEPLPAVHNPPEGAAKEVT